MRGRVGERERGNHYDRDAEWDEGTRWNSRDPRFVLMSNEEGDQANEDKLGRRGGIKYEERERERAC